MQKYSIILKGKNKIVPAVTLHALHPIQHPNMYYDIVKVSLNPGRN